MYPLPAWTWKYSPLYKYEVTALISNQRFDKECIKHVDRIRGLIEQHVVISEQPSLIETFIRESKHEHAGAAVTDHEVLENVKTLFIAGSDTTSVTITWIAYLLILHPLWRDKLRVEVDAVLGGRHKIPCTNEQVAQLVHVHAFVKEALRLYTAAPFIGIQLLSDTESYTCANGLIILPSDTIFLGVDGCLRNSTVFPSPDTFNPARWLVDTATLCKMEQYFMSFGSGPRVCPGQGLAYLECAMATAALVSHFDMTLDCPVSEIKRVLAFTASANKLPIIFHMRADA